MCDSRGERIIWVPYHWESLFLQPCLFTYCVVLNGGLPCPLRRSHLSPCLTLVSPVAALSRSTWTTWRRRTSAWSSGSTSWRRRSSRSLRRAVMACTKGWVWTHIYALGAIRPVLWMLSCIGSAVQAAWLLSRAAGSSLTVISTDRRSQAALQQFMQCCQSYISACAAVFWDAAVPSGLSPTMGHPN